MLLAQLHTFRLTTRWQEARAVAILLAIALVGVTVVGSVLLMISFDGLEEALTGAELVTYFVLVGLFVGYMWPLQLVAHQQKEYDRSVIMY
jgi:hypothetical protein